MHIEPPPTPLINIKNDKKLDKYRVQQKIGTFMSLTLPCVKNGNPDKFLLFVRNSQINLESSGTLATGAKIQYHRTIVSGEALRQLDMLSVEVGSITP